MKLTVAICTWNRAKLLDQTLKRMRDLRIPENVEWELLVVNNNCTDATDEVLHHHQNRLPLRRLYEAKPGKSHAANLAIQEARGDLILWTDDDVLVDPQWAASYVAAAHSWPQASYFGGTVDCWFEEPPPRWLLRNISLLSDLYALRIKLGDAVFPLPEKETIFGANMAFRREALKQFQFDTKLGPMKNNQIRGEETEVLQRMKAAGHLGVWVGNARVNHFIPAARLTTQYIWAWSHGMGRTYARMNDFTAGSCIGGVPRWIIRTYIEKRIQSWILTPFKGAAWIKSVMRAALFRGIIDEIRVSRCQRTPAGISPLLP
jgi:glycosyltransferase involved in cell wall biosynthesis